MISILRKSYELEIELESSNLTDEIETGEIYQSVNDSSGEK